MAASFTLKTLMIADLNHKVNETYYSMFKIVQLRKIIVAKRPVQEGFLKRCFDNEKI